MQAIDRAANADGHALRTVTQPVVLLARPGQAVGQLAGARLHLARRSGHAVADQQQAFAFGAEPHGPVVELHRAVVQRHQRLAEHHVALGQRFGALQQRSRFAVGRQAGADLPQAESQPVHAVGAAGCLVRSLAQPLAQGLGRLAGLAQATHQVAGPLAQLPFAAQELARTAQQAKDTHVQFVQRHLGARRLLQHQCPALAVERLVDLPGKLGCEALGEVGAAVVVAFGREDHDAARTGLNARYGPLAEVGGDQQRELRLADGHRMPRGRFVVHQPVAEGRALLEPADDLVTQTHRAALVLDAQIAVDDQRRQRVRAGARVPHAGEVDQGVRRRHQHHAQQQQPAVAQAAQQPQVGPDDLADVAARRHAQNRQPTPPDSDQGSRFSVSGLRAAPPSRRE